VNIVKCPKCEEGALVNVRFKLSGEKTTMCDSCGALWFLGEPLNPARAHNFRAFAKDLDIEHALEMSDDVDQEHSPLRYSSYK
jgi:hypothetical protein